VIAELQQQLKACGLEAALTVRVPASLDDKVPIALVAPVLSAVAGAEISGAPSLPDLAERALAATVEVAVGDSLGSGFLVDPDGLVVTARHVVEGEGHLSERAVKVVLPDEREVSGVVVRSHLRLDFALLWAQAKGPFVTLPLADPSSLRAGESLLAVGSPAGLRRTVSAGIVSNPAQRWKGVEYIQTDTAIDHGNSGGPLMNEDGVVGITLWGLGEVAHAKFALPIDYLVDDIAAIVKLGRDRSLAATYCPACGHLDDQHATWYCRNCGAEFAKEEK
jgi:S1-C subfamily serine protease